MTAESDPSPVTLRHENAVAIVTLNRPARRNAISRVMMEMLREKLMVCGQADAVAAVVLTGAGTAFCAGQDLGERDPRGRT